MHGLNKRLFDLLAPSLEALGYELWGVEHLSTQGRAVLRVYIEKEDGIRLEDCEAASRQVSTVLDVEDPIKSKYTLEVSSPGLDRRLFFPEQYRHYCGTQISLQLLTPLDGQRNFKGELLATSDEGIELSTDGQTIDVRFNNIQRAQVIPEIQRSKA